MTSPNPLADAFKQAAELAALVPDDLRTIAFQRALDAVLGPTPQAATTTPGSQGPGASPASAATAGRGSGARSASVTRLLETLDRTQLADALRGRKVLDRALLVLRAASGNGVDALTPGEVAELLTAKYREPTTPNAVRIALDRSPAFTDRRPNGGSFVYSIMASGEEYLDSLMGGAAANDAPPRSSPRRRGGTRKPRSSTARAPRAGPPATAQPPAPSEPSRARKGRTGTRPGPKVALEELVAEGYFATPRGMADILQHLKEVKTYVYRNSDMTSTLQRLVRNATLKRTRNSQGQYEYEQA